MWLKKIVTFVIKWIPCSLTLFVRWCYRGLKKNIRYVALYVSSLVSFNTYSHCIMLNIASSSWQLWIMWIIILNLQNLELRCKSHKRSKGIFIKKKKIFSMTILDYHPCYVPIKYTCLIKKSGHIKPTYLPLALQDPTKLNAITFPIMWANMYRSSLAAWAPFCLIIN